MMQECSQSNRELPCWGTAIDGKEFWFVEIAQPWERNILSSRDVSEMMLKGFKKLAKSGIQIFGLYVENPSDQRRIYRLKIDSTTSSLESALIDWNSPWTDHSLDFHRETIPTYFVCIHGERDQCCSKYGRQILEVESASNRVVKGCSHLGGHRFAPTLIDCELGLVWGRVQLSDWNDIVNRKGAPWDCIRGQIGFSSSAQILDAQMWKMKGWNWKHQRGQAHWKIDKKQSSVEFDQCTYQVSVEKQKHLGLGGCQKEPSELIWWNVVG